MLTKACKACTKCWIISFLLHLNERIFDSLYVQLLSKQIYWYVMFLFVICVCLSHALLCNSDHHMLCMLSNASQLLASKDYQFARCYVCSAELFPCPAEGTLALCFYMRHFWNQILVLWSAKCWQGFWKGIIPRIFSSESLFWMYQCTVHFFL